ncbi:pyruvate formate lyase family protein [Sporomusa termitida]|uniref:Choline trimethylamine-lyase n=1 Tax=Sporomusa termitida TaxID=2377 RepID=A0A517DX72_9FIRM|nr:pyruvate formate lyase family protein [Sporomusa termitida]QDR81954.1 Choline trimethylamine-lyase [Sporomusa termitida]
MQSASELFKTMCRDVAITLNDNEFVYFLDFSHLMDASRGYNFGNLTPDYSRFLKSGLSQLKYADNDCSNKFCVDYNSVTDSICMLITRICDELIRQQPHNYAAKLKWFQHMVDHPATNFREALQRILFLNQIIWQSNHRLVGLGGLDSLLIDYFNQDIENGRLSKEDALSIVENFFHILHENYRDKSNMLLGDTGQIIVLGKSDKQGGYIYNDLTLLFIQALERVQLPDPKILLRVNRNTPRNVLETAVKCIATGIGAPLLSNDGVILPQLTRFGIPLSDALDYTTSACWEPLIGGKDTSLNNMTTLNFMRSLNNLFMRDPLTKIDTFEEFKKRYFTYLAWNLNAVKRVIGMQRLQYDPVLSVFMEGCFESKKDVSHGGAVYHNVGITTVALANVVNALLNIKDAVFEKKTASLISIKKMIVTDFADMEDWISMLKSRVNKYGNDDNEIITLTNEITRFVSAETESFVTYLGGKMKFGLSAPTYIDAAKDFPASFDGRRKGEPFKVHISNEESTAYTEVVNFASALDYGDNRFNGNVVDFMITPDFINNNFDKFVDFIALSIENGFFQMQMNVVSSEKLIAARERPEKYSNLIVRVWGFSAYFNDLPEEYKDVLIERALKNERKAG